LITGENPIVQLVRVNLSDVEFGGVDLRGANLSGAIMPNGQKGEEWLKTNERGIGREDGQNTDPS
jgi:Pentapeptide repeats (8 copies)